MICNKAYNKDNSVKKKETLRKIAIVYYYNVNMQMLLDNSDHVMMLLSFPKDNRI